MVDRVEKFLEKLPHWWRKDDDSNTKKLFKAIAKDFDDLDDNKLKMKIDVYVTTATGYSLDDLGKLFKLSRRPTETDDQFRARIIAFFPGFSGGGTAPAISSTISKITGVPEPQITVTDIPDELKFQVNVLLNTPEQMALKDTIVDVVWGAKAAGCYPLFLWTIDGILTSETIHAPDIAEVIPEITQPGFIWELSLIDQEDVWEGIV